MSPDLEAIFARPIAHRGYHDANNGIIENTPTAIQKAIDKNFGIEVDVQQTSDNEALVFHDNDLDRLADGSGPVSGRTAAELVKYQMRTGTDHLWLLQDLFDRVDGRVPLVVEIKSLLRRDAQADFVRRVVDQVAAYKGPACIKTFDPDMLMIAKNHNSTVLRGIVADAARPGPDYTRHSRMDRFIMRHLLHFPRTSPHFVSYSVNDLPSPGPSFLKTMFKTPIMAWTVRTPGQWEVAKRFADQMVFEGFDPDQN